MRTTQASLRMPNPLGAHDAGAAATRPGGLRRAAEMRYPPRRWKAFAVAASRGRDANLCSDREHHRTGGLFLVRSGGLHCLLRCRRRPAVVRARPYMSAETPASLAAQARSIRPSSARQGRNAEGVREPAPRRASAAKPSALHRRRHSPSRTTGGEQKPRACAVLASWKQPRRGSFQLRFNFNLAASGSSAICAKG